VQVDGSEEDERSAGAGMISGVSGRFHARWKST
jgi:hypothetical protein